MKRANEIAKEWATVHHDNNYNTLDDLEKAILEAQREAFRLGLDAGAKYVDGCRSTGHHDFREIRDAIKSLPLPDGLKG